MNANTNCALRSFLHQLIGGLACLGFLAQASAAAEQAITYERLHDKIIPGAGFLVYYGSRCGVASDVDTDMVTLIGSMPVTASQSSELRSYWEQAKAGKLLEKTGVDWKGKIVSDIATSGNCSAETAGTYTKHLNDVHSVLVADTQKVLEDAAKAQAEKQAEASRRNAALDALLRPWGECIGGQIEKLDDGVTDAGTISSVVMRQCEMLSTDLIALVLQNRHVEDTPSARKDLVEYGKTEIVIPLVLKHRAANRP